MAKSENTFVESKEQLNTSAASGMDGGRMRMSIGIVVMLVGVFGAAIVTYVSGDDAFVGNIIMLLCMFICLSTAAFGLRTLSIVLTGLQVASFFAVRIYSMIVNGNFIPFLDYLWIAIPAVSMLGMTLFASGFELLKINNNVMMQQINELTIIDPLTSLYNLRGLYMDAQTQISYAERNGNKITLMVVKLRYPKEMQAVLKKDQFSMVIKRLATILTDTVRLEDKVYSIGSDGEFAILLTCDKVGAKIVEKRMRGKMDNTEWLAGVASRPIRAEVKMGYLEYNKERFNRDISGFLENVSEEVEYDI